MTTVSVCLSALAGQGLATRTWRYARELRGFQALQTAVAQPYFNATKDAAVLRAHDRLRDWLKDEADALWKEGVNVYR